MECINLSSQHKCDIVYACFDTESTGLAVDYLHKSPTIDLSQMSYVVQLAYKIFMLDCNGDIVELHRNSMLVMPLGSTCNSFDDIPADALAVHGHSMEQLYEHGKPIYEVLDAFKAKLDEYKVSFLIAHNAPYDLTILDYEFKRHKNRNYLYDYPCIDTKFLCKGFAAHVSNGSAKLVDIYRGLFGYDFENAHDALADVNACAAVFAECCKRLNIWPMKQCATALACYSAAKHETLPQSIFSPDWKELAQIDIAVISTTGDILFFKHIYIQDVNSTFDSKWLAEFNIKHSDCQTQGMHPTVAVDYVNALLQLTGNLVVMHNPYFVYGMWQSACMRASRFNALQFKPAIMGNSMVAAHLYSSICNVYGYVSRNDLIKTVSTYVDYEPAAISDAKNALQLLKHFYETNDSFAVFIRPTDIKYMKQ